MSIREYIINNIKQVDVTPRNGDSVEVVGWKKKMAINGDDDSSLPSLNVVGVTNV